MVPYAQDFFRFSPRCMDALPCRVCPHVGGWVSFRGSHSQGLPQDHKSQTGPHARMCVVFMARSDPHHPRKRTKSRLRSGKSHSGRTGAGTPAGVSRVKDA